MHEKLEDSRIPTVTDNVEENINTLFNGYNTARK